MRVAASGLGRLPLRNTDPWWSGGEGQVPGALGVAVVAFEPVGFFLVGDFGGEAFE